MFMALRSLWVFTTLPLIASSAAQMLELDPTFHQVGTYAALISGSDRTAGHSAAIRPDGSIVVCAMPTDDPLPATVFCFTSDGELDADFGNNGMVQTSMGEDTWVFPARITAQPDGKVLYSGSFYNLGSSTQDALLIRYNTDGTLDTSFGNGGIVTTDVEGRTDQLFMTLLRADGRFIACGETHDPEGQESLLLGYQPDGTLDQSFGDGGVVRFVADSGSEADAMAWQEDGKLLVSGISGNGVVIGNRQLLARFLSDGTLDSTFHEDGITGTQCGFYLAAGSDLCVLDDGRIVVTGGAEVEDGDWKFQINCYLPSGELDAAYGNGGCLSWGMMDQASSDMSPFVMLQADNDVIVAGHSYVWSEQYTQYLSMVRLDDLGVVDPSFGDAGVFTSTAGLNALEPWYTLQQPDGRFVMVGTTGNAYTDTGSVFIARYRFATPQGIAEEQGGHALRVFLSPDGAWTLAPDPDFGPGTSFFVRDALGRTMLHGRVDISSGSHPLPDLTPGTYVVELVNDRVRRNARITLP